MRRPDRTPTIENRPSGQAPEDKAAEWAAAIFRLQQNRWVRLIRRISLVMAIIFVILSLVPYFVPVSAATTMSELPFANSAFRTVNGVQLHYRVWPSSDAKPAPGSAAPESGATGPVLLIHGLGGSTVSWNDNAGALQAAGHYTVAVDLPGFGFSTRQTGLDHSQASRARLMWAFLETFENELPANQRGKPWHLVGHSMGGGTITAMALAAPERTAGLVLVDGAVFDSGPRTTGLLFKFPPASRWLQVIMERYLDGPERIAGILSSAAGQPMPPERVAAYYRALTVPGTARAFVDIVRTSRNEPIDGLGQLTMPVRAIWGEADTWVPIAQTEQIRQRVPRLELATIPGAGHLPMETHPDAFNPLLIRMLRG